MRVVKGFKEVTQAARHPVVSIGNFDGVHLGHREILSEAKRIAQERAGELVVYTFRPHPRSVLRPEQTPTLITTYDEKLELLAEVGVDMVVEEPFSRDFSNISPQRFFREVLLHRLSAEAVVVGYDFGFGRGREGQLEELKRLAGEAGVQLVVVSPQRFNGEVASSSAIRKLLQAGEVDRASELLGYSFFYEGVVIRGAGRGRKIGFPTANLSPVGKLVLPYGVYVTRSTVDGVIYPSVTNIGVRPTFEVTQDNSVDELVETHLLDQDLDLYGRKFRVEFLKRIRSEKKFSGVDDLKKQISDDCKVTRKAFSFP